MGSKIEISLKVDKDKVKDFKRALDAVIQDQVLVGVPEAKSPRKQGPINNAALAYIHNTGSPARNIPARPFMEPGVKDAKESIEPHMRSVAQAALKGAASAVDRGLNAVGLLVQNAIRRRINAGVPPPLKPGTLAARKRKGFQGEKPLIRTGQLRNSISYVIQRIKKKVK